MTISSTFSQRTDRLMQLFDKQARLNSNYGEKLEKMKQKLK